MKSHTEKKKRGGGTLIKGLQLLLFSLEYIDHSHFGFFEACFLFSLLYISGTYSLFVLHNLVLCTLRYSSFFLLFVDLWFCHTSFFLCIQLVSFFCVTALFFFYIFFFAGLPYAPSKTLRHEEARSLLFFYIYIYIFFSKASLQTNRFYCFSFQNIRLTSQDNFLLKKGTLGLSARVCVSVEFLLFE